MRNPIPIGLLLLLLCVGAARCEQDSDFGDGEPEAATHQSAPENEPEEPGFRPSRFAEPPLDLSNTYFVEYFNDASALGKRWQVSTAKKEGIEETLAKYNGQWSIGTPSKVVLEGDLGLIARSKARHHAIAAALPKPIEFKESDEFVVQYEVKYEEGQECGGGYLKLLSAGAERDIRSFADKTEYTIMFGPDKCGSQSKVHFIIKLRNPKNGTVSEHHAPQPKHIPEFTDRKTHLFTLRLRKDNSYEVLLDSSRLYSGNMLTDLVPSPQPPTQIADPTDKKPEDWDEEEFITDPEAKKPEDWDENEPEKIVDEDATMPSDWLEDEEPLIPDPNAEQPADWDEEMDGEYEPRLVPNPSCEGRSGCGKWSKPMKANPKYKGKWVAPRIKNPNYKGKWSPRLIDNPNHYQADPYSQLEKVTALGFELWTMSENILFDNIFIGSDADLAADFATHTFKLKNSLEAQLEQVENPTRNIFQTLVDYAEEKPWLWIVYALCVLIPVIALSAYLFGRKSKPTSDAKKTDAYQPDDEEEEKEELLNERDAKEVNKDEEEEDEPQPGPSTSRRHSSRRASQASNKSARDD